VGAEANGGDTEAIFTAFFQKYAFLSLLLSKFIFKTRFKITAKSVLMHLKDLRPRARATTCPHPLLRH